MKADRKHLEDQAEDLLDLVGHSVVSWTLDGKIELWNTASEELYGWSRHEIIGGRNPWEILECSGTPSIAQSTALTIERGTLSGEVSRRAKDGSALLVDVTWRLHRDEYGRPTGILETGRDITERMLAGRALAESEERYRILFNEMPVSLWQTDNTRLIAKLSELREAGVTDIAKLFIDRPGLVFELMDLVRVIEVNAFTAKVFGGRAPADFAGMPIRHFFEPSPDTYRRSIEARFSGKSAYSEEMRSQTLDGREFDLLYFVAFPPELTARGFNIVSCVDITEDIKARTALEQMRTDFAHAARISMLGELTASLAHEVNQPLAGITANGEAAARWLARPEPAIDRVTPLLGQIVADARRASGIIARIRAMASKRPAAAADFDLDQMVDEAVTFMRPEITRRRVAIDVHLDTAGAMVVGDRIQLQQVAANMLSNALHAVADQPLARRRITVRTVRVADDLVVEVQDLGNGVSPDVEARIFESFFTTKPEGLGMGLSLSRSIIEAHAGRIWHEPSHPVGARFFFALPATASS